MRREYQLICVIDGQLELLVEDGQEGQEGRRPKEDKRQGRAQCMAGGVALEVRVHHQVCLIPPEPISTC